MERRLDAGGLLVAAFAALLVVSLFLDWFGIADARVTGWQAFEVLDLVLAGAAVAAVAAAFGALPARLSLAAALLAAVVVVSQLIQPPPVVVGSAAREVGAWLALVAVAGLLAGAALAAAQIAVTVDVRGRERRPRVAAVDRRSPAAAYAPSPVAAAAAHGADGPSEAHEDAAPATSQDAFARPSTAGSVVAEDVQATQAFPAAPEPTEPR